MKRSAEGRDGEPATLDKERKGEREKRLLVIADTHGWVEAARRIIHDEGPWDFILHLGDSVLEAVELAAELKVEILAVPGNNEGGARPVPSKPLIFSIHRVVFYACHGHELDLNPCAGDWEAKLQELARRAKVAGGRVALFGHTHLPLLRELEGVLLFNPGALSAGDQRRTWGVITVFPGGKIQAEIKEL